MVSKIVSRLEKLDLVCRVKSASDERSVLVALTEEGRRYGDLIVVHFGRLLERALVTWSPDEADQLGRTMARFAHDLTAHTRFAIPMAAAPASGDGRPDRGPRVSAGRLAVLPGLERR